MEDPWAARTKEIKFAAADEDEASPADVAEENDGPEDEAKENKVSSRPLHLDAFTIELHNDLEVTLNIF